jgi:hypothetical protein
MEDLLLAIRTKAVADSRRREMVENISISIKRAGNLKKICDAIRANEGLKSLSLTYCEIDDNDAKEIAAAVGDSKSITTLNFSHNRIGAAGGNSIAEALLRSTTLTTLLLSCNRI